MPKGIGYKNKRKKRRLIGAQEGFALAPRQGPVIGPNAPFGGILGLLPPGGNRATDLHQLLSNPSQFNISELTTQLGLPDFFTNRGNVTIPNTNKVNTGGCNDLLDPISRGELSFADFEECLEASDPGRTGGGGGSVSAIFPPVLDVLAERRARRAEESARRLGIADRIIAASQQTLPQGVTTIPGFEAGGLADVLMGFVTGRGAAGPQIDRAAGTVRRQPLDELLEPVTEPTVGAELPGAIDEANQILSLLRLV